MREHKYRAWDIKQKIMCDVRILDFDFGTAFVSWMEENKQTKKMERVSNNAMTFTGDNPNLILMQFTGIEDRNGKDLDWYVGDIIQKGEIIRVITVDWEHGMRFMLGKHILCKQDGINGIRIGNIHSNPELLK